MSPKTTKKASKKATSPKAKRTKDTATESTTTWVEWDDGADAAPPAEPIVELDEQEMVDDAEPRTPAEDAILAEGAILAERVATGDMEVAAAIEALWDHELASDDVGLIQEAVATAERAIREADRQRNATQAPVSRAKRKAGNKPTTEPATPTGEHGAPVANDAATSSTITETTMPSEADVLAEALAAPMPSDIATEPTSAPDTTTAPTTLKGLADRYLAHLAATGKTESTVWGYGMELKTAMRFLGEDRRFDALTIGDIVAFNASPAVTRTKSGRGKAMPGILKTRRVLRLALVWAVEQGWLAEAPLPTKGAE